MEKEDSRRDTRPYRPHWVLAMKLVPPKYLEHESSTVFPREYLWIPDYALEKRMKRKIAIISAVNVNVLYCAFQCFSQSLPHTLLLHFYVRRWREGLRKGASRLTIKFPRALGLCSLDYSHSCGLEKRKGQRKKSGKAQKEKKPKK